MFNFNILIINPGSVKYLPNYFLSPYIFSVKRHLLRYQNPITGLYPVTSSEKQVGSIRDTIYCCMSTWSLGQAFKKINDDKGKCHELCQSTVLALQGRSFIYY